MRVFFRIVLAFVLSWQVLPVQGLAGESGDTISVVVSGVGRDANAALRNAYRAAVEQAVGSMVDADTLVRNDTVVSEQILSFSAGFVQTYRLLGKPTVIDGGLVSLRIAAEVKRNVLDEGLRRVGVIRAQVDGGSLLAEAQTKMDSLDDAIGMLESLMEKLQTDVVTISLDGRPGYDVANKKVVFNIKHQIDTRKYELFINQFETLLKNIGAKQSGVMELPIIVRELQTPSTWPMTTITDVQKNNLRYTSVYPESLKFLYTMSRHLDITNSPIINVPNNIWPDRNAGLILISNHWPNLRRIGQESKTSFKGFVVPREIFLMMRHTFRRPSTVIQVKSYDNTILAECKIQSFLPYFVSDGRLLFWLATNVAEFKNAVFFPVLHAMIPIRNTGIAGNTGTAGNFWPATTEYKWQLLLDIPLENLDKISHLEFSYE